MLVCNRDLEKSKIKRVAKVVSPQPGPISHPKCLYSHWVFHPRKQFERTSSPEDCLKGVSPFAEIWRFFAFKESGSAPPNQSSLLQEPGNSIAMLGYVKGHEARRKMLSRLLGGSLLVLALLRD